MSNPNPEIPAADPIQQAIDNITQPPVIEVAIPGTPQVFRGANPQAVIDQMVRAQAEATRTIQESRARAAQLEHELQTARQQIPPPAAPDPNQFQEYYTEWAHNPNEATKAQLADMLGVPKDQVVDLIKRTIENSAVNTAADEFLARCPDFPNNAQTSAMLKDTVARKYGVHPGAISADNLEVSYHQLIREGRLTPNALPAETILQPNTPMPNLRGNSAPPNPVNDILAQARSMPIDQLKQVIDRLSSQGR